MTSKFFTNETGRGLFDKFTGITDNMKDLHAFYAVIGYFRSSGYFELQPFLKDLKEIKILDALGGTTGERDAVYEAVIDLVSKRLNRARTITN